MVIEPFLFFFSPSSFGFKIDGFDGFYRFVDATDAAQLGDKLRYVCITI